METRKGLEVGKRAKTLVRRHIRIMPTEYDETYTEEATGAKMPLPWAIPTAYMATVGPKCPKWLADKVNGKVYRLSEMLKDHRLIEKHGKQVVIGAITVLVDMAVKERTGEQLSLPY